MPKADAKHTPGPWRVVVGICKNDHPDTSADVYGPQTTHVANCGCSEEARANAALIAAAPDLLAALRPFAEGDSDLTDAYCHSGVRTAEECTRCGPVLRARAAITKATGGAP